MSAKVDWWYGALHDGASLPAGFWVGRITEGRP